MGNEFELKCDGLVCPLPVAKTKRKLLEMASGDILKVSGDYAEAGENIKNYIEKHGENKILEFVVDGQNFLIKIQKS
ncbi:MAG: sulfurtransferase TusA family protein [Candidatus Hodarchaeota archaeon]